MFPRRTVVSSEAWVISSCQLKGEGDEIPHPLQRREPGLMPKVRAWARIKRKLAGAKRGWEKSIGTNYTEMGRHPYTVLKVLLIVRGSSDGKESACNAGDSGSVFISGRSAGEGKATHANILAWEIPWTEEPGRLLPMVSQRVRHDWATNTFHS